MKNLKKSYYKILILSLALLALAISGIYNELIAKSDDDIIISQTGENLEIIVHISGQVLNEGVYKLELGSRTGDLIEISGGLKEDADLTNVNLAEKLKDSQKVFIPSKVKDKLESSGGEEDKTDSQGLISLEEFNVLSKDELEKLPGVGPVLANNIIEYRNRNGSFMKIDDLINVSGIGEKKLESIKSCFK